MAVAEVVEPHGLADRVCDGGEPEAAAEGVAADGSAFGSGEDKAIDRHSIHPPISALRGWVVLHGVEAGSVRVTAGSLSLSAPLWLLVERCFSVIGGTQQGRLIGPARSGLIILDLESRATSIIGKDAGRLSDLHPLSDSHFSVQSHGSISARPYDEPTRDDLVIEHGGNVDVSGDRSLLALFDWAVPLGFPDYLEIDGNSVRRRQVTVDHWIAANVGGDEPAVFRLNPRGRGFIVWNVRIGGPWLVVDEAGTVLEEITLGGAYAPHFVFRDDLVVVARFDELFVLDSSWAVMWSARLKIDNSGSHIGAITSHSEDCLLLSWWGRRRSDPAEVEDTTAGDFPDWAGLGTSRFPIAVPDRGRVLGFNLRDREIAKAAEFEDWPRQATAFQGVVYAQTWGNPNRIHQSRLEPAQWEMYPVRPPGAKVWY